MHPITGPRTACTGAANCNHSVDMRVRDARRAIRGVAPYSPLLLPPISEPCVGMKCLRMPKKARRSFSKLDAHCHKGIMRARFQANSQVGRTACHNSVMRAFECGAVVVRLAWHRQFLMNEANLPDLRYEFGRSPKIAFDLFFARDTMVAVSAEMEFCTVSHSSAFCIAACAAPFCI